MTRFLCRLLLLFFAAGCVLADQVPPTLSYPAKVKYWKVTTGLMAARIVDTQNPDQVASCQTATNIMNEGKTGSQLRTYVGISTTGDGSSGSCFNKLAAFSADLWLMGSVLICPTGSTLENGLCVQRTCESGFTLNANNMCVGCPAGKEDVNGQCLTICPSSYHRHVPDDGQCEKDCIGDQFQKADGLCGCTTSGNQIVSFSSSAKFGSRGCNNGCIYQLASVGIGFNTVYTWGKRNGDICGANTSLTPAPPLVNLPQMPPADTSGTGSDGSTPDPMNTPQNNNNPMDCGAAGGAWGTYNGVGKCLTPSANNPITTQTPSTTTTTNPDGSTTTTEGTTSTTCDGKSCTTTTTSTTTGPGGTSTTTTTGAGNGTGTGTGTGSGTGEGNGGGEDQGDCTLEPEAPYCKSGTVKEKGQFEEGQDAKLNEAKGAVTAKLNEIRAALSSAFAASAPGAAGSLPCPAPVSVLGRNISLCVSDYDAELSVIGSIIVFAAAIVAILLVVTV